MGVRISKVVVLGLVAAVIAASAAWLVSGSTAGAGTDPDLRVIVSKSIAGDVDGYDLSTEFTIELVCGTFEQTQGIAGGGIAEFLVPAEQDGQTCTVTETARPDAATDLGCSWAEQELPSDSGTLTAAGSPLELSITNTIEGCELGRIIVAKETVPAGASQEFDFTTTYGPPFTLQDGEQNVSIVEPGDYTVEETVPPGWTLIDASCNDGSPIDDVYVEPGETVTCTFVNEADIGRVQVTKSVSGETDAYDGSPFGFDLDCDGEAFDESFTLVAGETFTSGDIPVGTTCVITETSTPELPPGFVFGAPTFDPSAEVVVAEMGQVVTVAVDNPILDESGEIIVVKETVPEGSSQLFAFTASYDGDGFELGDGESDNSGPLAPGEYSVAEIVPDGWVLTSATCDDDSPIDAIDLQADETVTCTFVNTEQDDVVGAFSVTKTISGATEGYEGGAFGFIAQCNGSEIAFDLDPGETFTSDPLPVGTECTIVEVLALLPELADGFEFGEITFDPSQTVTIAADSVIAVTVDNAIVELGTLTVVKTLSGFTEGYDPATSFTVTIDCDDEALDQSVQITPTQSATITDIPFGTECTVTETGVPAPLPGFFYKEPTYEPGQTVTITDDTPNVSVTVDNPIDPPGFIEVTKRVAGGPAPAGAVFSFSLDCDLDEFDQTFTLTADQTIRLGPVQEFAVCTVAETSIPGGFGTPAFSPSATVTVQPNATTAITVTNTLASSIAITGSSSLLPLGLAFILIGSGIVLVAYGPLRRRSVA